MQRDPGTPSALPDAGIVVVYDGECPFCAAFVKMIRLEAAAGPVVLVDARRDPATATRLAAAGYDLDAGMVVTIGGRSYHGADAIHAIALMTSRSGVFNRLVGAIFRRPKLAAALYPALRAGRDLVLRLLGRRRFGAIASSPPPRR